MKPIAWVLLAALATASSAVHAQEIAPFSSAAPGLELPGGWSLALVPGVKPIEPRIVAGDGARVLRVFSAAAAGSVLHRLTTETAARPLLRWRWKVDRVIGGADLSRKDGDDYAARVYVAFDLPGSSLTFAERSRLAVGRLLYGADVPAAALCYVWDNRHAPGTVAWNSHSTQVRMVVLQSGNVRAGQWVEEVRDVEADWRAAFGERYPGPVPRIAGVAVSADTDQTGETVTAWFGDLRLGPRP